MAHFRPFLPHWLFTLEGDDDHLYRAIPPAHEPYLKVASAVPGFMPFTRTEHEIDVGVRRCSIIKIPRLPFQVRIQELTRHDAMRTIRFLIDFARRCHAHGYTPWYLHEGNVLWWDGPHMVDFDAITPMTHSTSAQTFVRIGYLMYRYVFGRALPSHDTFDFRELERQGGWMAEQIHRRDFTDPAIWTALANVMAGVQAPVPNSSHWSSEYASKDLRAIASNPKFRSALDLVPAGRTLLDVGCNKGYACALLRERFDSVLGFDADEASIDDAAEFVRPGLNFAHFDLQHLRLSEPIPIHERFHADVVLALAVTHHFDNAGLSVKECASTLARLTKKALVIEDIVHARAYSEELASQGLKLARRVPSFPADRWLSLWVR